MLRQRNIQRALNRGESYHKLVRAVAYANGKLRVRTDQEQQLWSECSRLLANCIIYYNACILSELLERTERKQDYQRADAIKRANPASWKHVNLYGACTFLDIGDGVDLQELVNLLEAARGGCAGASGERPVGCKQRAAESDPARRKRDRAPSGIHLSLPRSRGLLAAAADHRGRRHRLCR